MPYLQYTVAFGNKFISSFVCKPMCYSAYECINEKGDLAVVKFLVIVFL